MEKVLGIIAEYNPLHNGHIYHIKKTKEITGADVTVAVITGNFTQRGETSIVNKWDKAKMALTSGEIDLVIELPTLYSISSAENFASGGVKILNEIGITDYISFGIERKSDNKIENQVIENDVTEKRDTINAMEEIAIIFYKEPQEYLELLKEELKNGISYPKARVNAIVKYTNNDQYGEILLGANNILGIEYIKALKKLNETGKIKRKITPIGIERKKVNHNSMQIVEDFASGTEIRSLLAKEDIEKIKNVVPQSSFDILKENLKNGTYISNTSSDKNANTTDGEIGINISNLKPFEKEIIYKLRTMTIKEIEKLPDVTEGMEYLIKEEVAKTNNIDELINGIKSKRYTQTRIQRILLYVLLNITKEDMEWSKMMTPYIRILGCNEKGKDLLSKMDSKNIITSVKRFEEINQDERYARMLEIDKIATDIYTIGYKENSKANLDYIMRNSNN